MGQRGLAAEEKRSENRCGVRIDARGQGTGGQEEFTRPAPRCDGSRPKLESARSEALLPPVETSMFRTNLAPALGRTIFTSRCQRNVSLSAQNQLPLLTQTQPAVGHKSGKRPSIGSSCLSQL